MATTKRSVLQRAADQLWLEREYIRGTTNPDVLAKSLSSQRPYNLSGNQIKYDLKDLKATWLSTVQADVAEARRLQLLQLNDQLSELWAAWEKSKLDATTEATKVKARTLGPAKDGKDQAKAVGDQEIERASKKVGQAGDASFQRLILDVLTRRAKLLGIDAPERTEFSGPNGGKIEMEVKGKDPFDYAKYQELASSFFGTLKENGSGESVHPAHPDPKTGNLPGADRP